MQKEILTSICALGLLFGASSAFAGAYGEPVDSEEVPVASPAPAPVAVVEEEISYARIGPYIGLGGLYAVELFDDAIPNGGPRTGNSGGFHVQAGYRWHPNAAFEARYEYYNRFDLDPGHISAWSATLNAKGYLLTGRFQPYGLIGMGYLDGNGSAGNNPAAAHPSTGFAMRFGGGLDAYVAEHVTIGPEFAYVLPTGSNKDLDMFTIAFGAQYVF